MDEQVGGRETGVVPVRDLTHEQRDIYDQRLAEVLRNGDSQVARVSENYMEVVDGQSGQVKGVFDPEKKGNQNNPEVCPWARRGFDMVSMAVDRARGKPGKLENGWWLDLAPTVKAGYDDLVADRLSGQEELVFVYNKALRRLGGVRVILCRNYFLV